MRKEKIQAINELDAANEKMEKQSKKFELNIEKMKAHFKEEVSNFEE